MVTTLPAREEKLLPPGPGSALSPGCGLEPGWGTVRTSQAFLLPKGM